jgi:hypothetical protein
MPVSEWQYIAEDTSTQSDVMQCEKSNYAPEGKNLWIRGHLQRQLWIVLFSNVLSSSDAQYSWNKITKTQIQISCQNEMGFTEIG